MVAVTPSSSLVKCSPIATMIGWVLHAVVGPLLLMPATVVQPQWVHEAGPGTSPEQIRASTDWIAANVVGYQVTNILLSVGLFVIATFAVRLGRSARGRFSRMLAVGGWMVGLGYVAGAFANSVLSTARVALAQDGIDPALGTQVFLQLSNGTALAAFFLPYLVLPAVGAIVLVVSLIANRAVPWWVALVGAVALAIPVLLPAVILAAVALAAGLCVVAVFVALNQPEPQNRALIDS